MSAACRPYALSARYYRAAVFDMDGVITDTAETHAKAWKQLFDPFLAEHVTSSHDQETGRPFATEDYLRYVDGKPRDAGVADFLASRRIALPRGHAEDSPDTMSIWGLANRKDALFHRLLERGGARAFPSSVAFVRDLQGRGVGTAIVSASRNCREILDAAGLGDLFPVRVDGCDAARLELRGKPSPDVFVEAARRLGTTPANALVVEDALAGVEAGRAGEFALVIGIARRPGQRAALGACGADLVVSDLSEIVVTG